MKFHANAMRAATTLIVAVAAFMHVSSSRAQSGVTEEQANLLRAFNEVSMQKPMVDGIVKTCVQLDGALAPRMREGLDAWREDNEGYVLYAESRRMEWLALAQRLYGKSASDINAHFAALEDQFTRLFAESIKDADNYSRKEACRNAADDMRAGAYDIARSNRDLRDWLDARIGTR